MLRIEMEVSSVLRQLCLQSQVYTLLALAVEVNQLNARTSLQEVRLQAHFERRWILLAILHQTKELYSR